MPKFIRGDSYRFSRLGKNRKKLQKWRRPTGTHSKTRRKRKGYPVVPQIGFKRANITSGKVKGLNPLLINNLFDLNLVKKDSILIISRKLGAKKKMEIMKIANEKGIKVLNAGGKK